MLDSFCFTVISDDVTAFFQIVRLWIAISITE
jgi:hypothetical protein